VSGTWALIRKRDVAVDIVLPIVPTDVNDSLELARDKRYRLEAGDIVTFAMGTKMPYFD